MITCNVEADKQLQNIEIGFSSISSFVDLAKGEKIILDNVSGCFYPGKLIGILGPSGSGKTTLLNILSGFKNRKLKGNIYINGEERNMDSFKKVSCYITQDNYLQGLLTVEENMKYSADFKLGNSVSQESKDRIIYDILKKFGLLEIRQTPTKRISGGQQKRLSIALELVNNPNVIFLDEPTTGLDSLSCFQCMEYLKHLAEEGRTIICTIHQPSDSVFKLFGQVYILSGGKCLYNGDTSQIVSFMENLGLPCPKYHNPADYVIEVAIGDYGNHGIDLMVKSSGNGVDKTYLQKYEENKDIIYDPQMFNKRTLRTNTTLYETKTLLKRDFLKMKRDPLMTHLRLIACVTNSLAISLLFWKIGSDASKIIFNYSFMLAFMVNLAVGGLWTTVLSFPKELSLLKKEHFNGYYSLTNYFYTITIMDIPVSLVYGIVSTVIVYLLTGQPLELHRIARFTTIGFLVTINAQSLGLLLGTYFNIQNGAFIASFIHFPLMLLSGFFLLPINLPKSFEWLSYLSYVRYAVEGMTSSIYGYNRSKLPCELKDFCLHTYGEDFLRDIGVKRNRFWIDVGALIIFYLVFRIIAYISMSRILKHRN